MQRVYGPYRDRNGWRVTARSGVGEEAKRRNWVFPTEQAALQYKASLLRSAEGRTVGKVIEMYIEHLKVNGRKRSTLITARYRLYGMLSAVEDMYLEDVNSTKALVLYESYTAGRSASTHQGALTSVKQMFEWARKPPRAWIAKSPWLDVDPIGTKERGKAQLTKDQVRKFYRFAMGRIEHCDRSLGVLLALVMGLRAHEVVGIEASDLDDGGRELRVVRSKTKAGIRNLTIPESLRRALELRVNRPGKLLPYKPGWVRGATWWVCDQVGADKVCAQALRGMNATIALEAGMSGVQVARSLGHADGGQTARANYAQVGAGESGRISSVIEKLEDRALN